MKLQNESFIINVEKSKFDEDSEIFRISANYFDLTIDKRLELLNLMKEWISNEDNKLNNIKNKQL
jgi:hypothetical protein